MGPKAYCRECGKEVSFNVLRHNVGLIVRGIPVECPELTAVCPECGSEIEINDIRVKNTKARKAAYELAALALV